MNKKRSTIIAGLLIIAAAIAGWQVFASRSIPEEQIPRPASGVLIGNTLAEFKLADLSGKQVSVGIPGKITVINFWATWCPPCRAEMPELEAFALKHGSQIAFYAINIQESRDTVQEFLKQNKLTMPVLLDEQGETARKFRVSAIPTTVISDKQGIIRFRKSGTVTLSELEGIIKGF